MRDDEIDPARWPLTAAAVRDGDDPTDDDGDGDEDPALGNAVLRALAAAGYLHKLGDGVWLDTGSGPGWGR